MKRKTILFSLLIAFSFPSFAQRQQQTQQLDSIFAMMAAQNQFNGTVLIAEHGKTILKKGYGYRNEQKKQLNSVKTTFELASCTKQFTATAIMLLKRQGKLSYEDRLSTYFPSLSFWDKVTIYDLLKHTSGLPEFLVTMPKYWDSTKIATNEDLIQFYANRKDTLQFEPGSRHRYNNTNYVLLASIIERVSGDRYADFLAANIFRPLKMKNTFVYNSRQQPSSLKNHATGYNWARNSFEKVTLDDPKNGDRSVYTMDGIVGAAKISSNLEDLSKWVTALNQNTLLSKSEFEEMTAITQTSLGKNIPYGFGLELSKGSNKFSFGHSGSWDGYATFIYHNVIKDRTIITLQNFKMGAYPFENINQVLNGQPITVEYRKKISLPDTLIQQFVGTYIDEQNKDEVQFISFLDGHLAHNSQKVAWDMRFFPVSANEFQAVRQGGTDGVLRFTLLKNGDVKLDMLQYGELIGSGLKRRSNDTDTKLKGISNR